jgi:transmembrane 9 superfamily member 3
VLQSLIESYLNLNFHLFAGRVNAVPRPIPEKKWFMEPLVIILLGGILPFGSIFIEM